MNHLIHFRSHIEGRHASESTSQKVRGPWVEVGSIRPYVTGDDPRNIAWKKWVWIGTIYTKEREISEHAPVIFISLLNREYADFHTLSHPVSKNDFFTALQKSLSESALHLRFPLEQIVSGTDNIAQLQRSRSIILILGDIENRKNENEFLHLSRDNDIIFLSLFQRVELDPFEEEIWFESTIVKQEYREALKWAKIAQEKLLHEHRVAIIQCTTEDNPVHLLNHFFKYRYAR